MDSIKNDEVLIEVIKATKRDVVKKMPRLAEEPLFEYNEVIREEVEYLMIERVKKECDIIFGKRKTKCEILLYT